VKIVRFWLLILAALACTAPLGAQENGAQEIGAQIDAPGPNWKTTGAAATEDGATVNWARLTVDAGDAALQASQQTSQQTSQTAAPAAGSGPATPAAIPAVTSAATPGAPSAAVSETKTPAANLAITPQSDEEKSRREKAEQQLKEQEHQRVLGILPSFNVSYRSDAISLTGWQKVSLALHTSVDPVTFASAFLVAGYHEGLNDLGFGWGIKGYGQRAGAAYLDAFDGNMIGNGFLPALLHQDPRYFRLGHGSATHRLLYAISTNFICKHDNTGKWEPNYSNITGNIASGAISNLYYPGSNSGFGLTISNGMIVTAEGGIGSIFQEFWPDISRKILHKDPTHGLDAQFSATGVPAGAAQK
jgi:hypothetical protein